MKNAVLLAILAIALLVMSVSANQAQPVAVITELAVDLSPPIIAIETDCLVSETMAVTAEKITDLTQNTLFDMQTQNRICKIQTLIRTLRHSASGLFAVNIGFQPTTQTINYIKPSIS